MRGSQFAELNAFVAVAEHNSFSKAATQLGISPATLSQTIKGLEERLGVRLLNRTTRSVAMTDAGERLLARLRPVFEDYEAAVDSVNTFRDKPAGNLRVTMPPPVASWVVGPLLPRFLAEYPEIKLEISVTTELVDIVAKHFDAGIRNEKRLERDMIAVKLGGDMKYAVVASPEYLAHRPRPETPQDLQKHNCIRFRLGNGHMLPWMFHIDGADTEVEVDGTLIVNNVDLARRAIEEGVGLLYAPYEYVLKPLAEKQLVQVLDNWMPEQTDGFFLYYPSRRQHPVALQVFINFMRKNTAPSQSGDRKRKQPAR